MTVNLQVTFIDQGDKRVSMTIADPRSDLTALEVEEAMNSIIEQDVFQSKAGSLVGISGARIIEREVRELDMGI